ncbi:MAG: hypothetical protein LBV12_02915 [Puniceicoccales bacterium]|nr:hypothetical protein [Puniceicoccales bacterium]
MSQQNASGTDVAAQTIASIEPPPVPGQVVPLRPNPMRAVWFMGGILAIFLAIILIKEPGIRHLGLQILPPLFLLVLGTVLYLVYRPETLSRIFGGIGIVLSAILYSGAHASSVTTVHQAPDTAYWEIFTHSLGATLTSGVVLGGILFTFGILLREKIGLTAVAWIAGGASFVIGLFFRISMLLRPEIPLEVKISSFWHLATEALFLAPAILAIRTLCELKSSRIRVSIGARIWCILVVAGTTAAPIAIFANEQKQDMPMAILILPAIIGMGMLCFGRRIGFPVALMGVGLATIWSAGQILPFSQERIPVAIGAVLGGLINPLITWALIRKAWKERLPELTAADYKKRLIVFLIFDFLGVAGGLILTCLGLHTLFTEEFQIEPFFFGVICGSLMTALALTAAVLYLKRKGRTGLALQILGLISGLMGIFLMFAGIAALLKS